MSYRTLSAAEIAQLLSQGNVADDWSLVEVADPFDVSCVRSTTFRGHVFLGSLERGERSVLGRTVPEGITCSTLRNVVVGAHTAIHHVCLLDGYHLGSGVTLFNIGSMTCRADVEGLEWLEPMNENGQRRLLPCVGMRVGDAYLWARYRGRRRLMEQFESFTRQFLASDGGRQGQVGDGAAIINVNTIADVAVQSSAADATLIDGATALRSGVVGSGSTVGDGVVAQRFLLGEHVHLEAGLRLNDSVVGDNSTLARGEVASSLLFPGHEQHHASSFLIAALVRGQSNVAAGAVIGSNHNSRTPDGEVAAGRGFWPGLCASFKHSSRFASCCLVAKGDYPYELDIPLPFALVSNNVSRDRLEVLPAYWWLYNMYALDRNSRKYVARDHRVLREQHIVFDLLAPDTADEMLHALNLLETLRDDGDGTWVADGYEHSHRRVVVVKADAGRSAYRDMLVHYAMSVLGDNLPVEPDDVPCSGWHNVGGQLVCGADLERMLDDVEAGVIDSWAALHTRLDSLWQSYPVQRRAHAYGVLCRLEGVERITEGLWRQLCERHAAILKYIEEQKAASRQKDETNAFRRSTFLDDDERSAVWS